MQQAAGGLHLPQLVCLDHPSQGRLQGQVRHGPAQGSDGAVRVQGIKSIQLPQRLHQGCLAGRREAVRAGGISSRMQGCSGALW